MAMNTPIKWCVNSHCCAAIPIAQHFCPYCNTPQLAWYLAQERKESKK